MNDQNHPSRRRVCAAALGAALTTACAVAALPALAQTFPARDFSGVIMWGAGGATDVVARAVAPLAEGALGRKIVLQNRSGGAGAISTNFVNQQASDGYTLLMGAENPQLHGVMSLGENEVATGAAVETSGRWGDYYQMTVDPVDDCTFWFVGMYRPSGSWATRASDFKFSNCGGFFVFCSNNDSIGSQCEAR